MLFIVSWSISSANRNSAIERFLKTGGAPPAGVKMLGRWHAVGGASGFGVAEASDPAADSEVGAGMERPHDHGGPGGTDR